MLVLILDTQTAISGAQEGAMLCFATVIPTLLPFFVLSTLLTASLTGIRISLLKPMERLLRIPGGTGSLFLIGILGGYPAGAMAVAEANHRGQLADNAARRMLGFCSNAGPSFLFGIAGAAFEQRWIPWLLWVIHILSAVLTAVILPGKFAESCVLDRKTVTVSQALDQGIKTMGRVCGWIVLFRVLIAFCNRWFLWALDTPWQIGINGILELTIGCTALGYIENTGLRLILCAGMLGFGGLCVAMQTQSVCAKLGMGYYLPGKLLQAGSSVIFASIAQLWFLPQTERCNISLIFFVISAVIFAIMTLAVKKGIAFRKIMVYNPFNRQKREAATCSSESASRNPAPTAASAPGSTTSRSSAPNGVPYPRIISA